MASASISYKDRLLPHLADYRRSVLGIPEAGVFHHRGRDVSVEHVLPRSAGKWVAIPDEGRSTVQSVVTKYGVKLHRHFHHLNSSQAFALSLFAPFFEPRGVAARALLHALGIAEDDIRDWRPEAVPNSQEGTNLDAWWLTESGIEYFCEVKLTEAEFGSARNDSRHQEKLRTIYLPRLEGLVASKLLAPAPFFSAYQILRNIWHAASSPTARVLFLFPRGQPALSRQLDVVLDSLAPTLRNRVFVAHTEDVLVSLAAKASPTTLGRYATALAAKYLPPTT